MRGRPILVVGCIALLAGVTGGCARKVPLPRWGELEHDRATAVHRVAVVGGKSAPTAEACLLGMTKAMVEAVHMGRRYQVRSYRDVLIALSRPDVDASPDAGAMEPVLAAQLAEKLGVDGVIVLSMSRCGIEAGDALAVGLFAAPDGVRIGRYQTERPGLRGQGFYNAGSNFQAMARETVDALGRTLDGTPATP